MAQRQAVVGRHISRTEARAAEAGLDDRTGFQQRLRHAQARQGEADRDGRGINAHREIAVADRSAAQDLRSLVNIIKHTARAARDDALIGPDTAVVKLVQQMHVGLRPAPFCLGLHTGQQFLRVRKKVTDGVRVRRVERQRDHRLKLAEIQLDHAVIIRAILRRQLFIRFGAAVNFKKPFRLLVRLPDGGQAGRLGRHDVDAVAEINGQLRNAGACEFQHAVLDEAACECRLDQCDCRVVRADAPAGRSRHIDQHDLGKRRVPRVPQKLLGKLRPALADGHRAERAIARVRVRA